VRPVISTIDELVQHAEAFTPEKFRQMVEAFYSFAHYGFSHALERSQQSNDPQSLGEIIESHDYSFIELETKDLPWCFTEVDPHRLKELKDNFLQMVPLISPSVLVELEQEDSSIFLRQGSFKSCWLLQNRHLAIKQYIEKHKPSSSLRIPKYTLAGSWDPITDPFKAPLDFEYGSICSGGWHTLFNQIEMTNLIERAAPVTPLGMTESGHFMVAQPYEGLTTSYWVEIAHFMKSWYRHPLSEKYNFLNQATEYGYFFRLKDLTYPDGEPVVIGLGDLKAGNVIGNKIIDLEGRFVREATYASPHQKILLGKIKETQLSRGLPVRPEWVPLFQQRQEWMNQTKPVTEISREPTRLAAPPPERSVKIAEQRILNP
jgi:hypothetical protein